MMSSVSRLSNDELCMQAQAQECMIERSIADQGKPSVLSKLAVQCSLWYQEVHDAVLPDRKVLDKYGMAWNSSF